MANFKPALTPKKALKLTFNDREWGGERTIKEWLKDLLSTLWEQGEGFSGKRPFGNSGWESTFQIVLIQNGCVIGAITSYDDEDEECREVTSIDEKAYNQFVFDMIEAL